MHQLAFTPCVHLSGFHSGADVCRQVCRSFRHAALRLVVELGEGAATQRVYPRQPRGRIS